MKRYFFTLLLIVTAAFSDTLHTSVPFEKAYPLLQKIDDKAIILGKGDKDIYVFIDPLCRYSRKFLNNVLSSKKMLKKYRYHLFMYEIPRLHSKALIDAIYNQENKAESLISVMVGNKTLDTNSSIESQERGTVNDIAQVAKQLDVFKRPYIIVSQQGE